ncbi:MAG: hypothetical protein ABJC12_05605 [Saprospiraceae bacterium]
MRHYYAMSDSMYTVYMYRPVGFIIEFNSTPVSKRKSSFLFYLYSIFIKAISRIYLSFASLILIPVKSAWDGKKFLYMTWIYIQQTKSLQKLVYWRKYKD